MEAIVQQGIAQQITGKIVTFRLYSEQYGL